MIGDNLYDAVAAIGALIIRYNNAGFDAKQS